MILIILKIREVIWPDWVDLLVQRAYDSKLAEIGKKLIFSFR